jgi:hypothetical protein
MSEGASGEQLAAMAVGLSAGKGELDTLDKALTAVSEIVQGCQHAGITLVRGGRTVETAAASSQRAERADRLQYELEEGPGPDSTASQQTIWCPDLQADPRWPNWGPRVVRELGIRSVVCFQLVTTAPAMGTLSLYAESPDAFDAADLGTGVNVAAHVAVALAASRKIDSRDVAIVNRTVIGQAEGILMERYAIDATNAFSVLKRLSQDTQSKLALVAAELVRTRQLPRVPAVLEGGRPGEAQG